MTTNDNADPRLLKLERWIAALPGPPVERIAPASADASFRRYFRVHRGGGSVDEGAGFPSTVAGSMSSTRVPSGSNRLT